MNRPTILVVDDEPYITQMLGMVLDLSLDVAVITTNSPHEAQKILRQGTISLLLTDHLMPGLNGINLVRALRLEGNTIPAVLLTGYCDEPELAAHTELLKPFEVIVKPWNNEHLVQRVKTWLADSL